MDESPPEMIRFRTTTPLEIVPGPTTGPTEGSSDAGNCSDSHVSPAAPLPDTAVDSGGGRLALSGAALAWIKVGVLLVLIAVLVPTQTSAADLEPFRPALLTASVALSVFAVSLSFVIFQLSPYRELANGPTRRHLAGATAMLLTALVPLIALAFSPNASAHVALAILPVEVFACLLLFRLAQREASPQVLLARRINKLAVHARCFALVRPLRVAGAEIERIERPPRSDGGRPAPPPMHELFHRLLPPPPQNDPLELLTSLSKAAVSRGDEFTYTLAVRRGLDVLEWTRELPVSGPNGKPDWTIQNVLVEDAQRTLSRIGQAALSSDHTTGHADHFIDECLRIVRSAIMAGRQGDRAVLDLWHEAADVAAALVRRGSRYSPVTLLMIGRLATEQGLVSVADWEEKYSLASYAASIESLGRIAIECRDTDFFYRCLEAIAWIGCAAVRERERNVCTTCLQALAQLGREVRITSLECFWQKCLLTPYDHVEERIYWMLSWVPSLPEAIQPAWCTLIGEALSRLAGYRCTVTIKTREDGSPDPRAVMDSSRPYTESIDDNGRVRTIDYSDQHMLKELELR